MKWCLICTALKHYTSKLSDYGDLDDLQTFGFRGEALSSLCALSDFHIITAKADASSKGSRLNFEISGKLQNVSTVAAQKGTTVCVEKLFKNLPVRQRELEKNIKREYAKVLNILQAYACICVNVKFTVSNQMPKGKRTIAFSTNGNAATRENIANVYGAKTLPALTPLNLKLYMQTATGSTIQSNNLQSDKSKEVSIQGHISRPVLGEGRLAPDRQMFFVNSRPCLLPQVAKAFNEVYKAFNMSQSPFIFANLIMDTKAYDVNVSPDKRTILLHDQTALLDSLKQELTALFESCDHTMPTSQLQNQKLPQFRSPSNLLSSLSTETSLDDSPSVAVASQVEPQSPSRLIHAWVGRDAIDRSSTIRQNTVANTRPTADKSSARLPVADVNSYKPIQRITTETVMIDDENESTANPDASQSSEDTPNIREFHRRPANHVQSDVHEPAFNANIIDKHETSKKGGFLKPQTKNTSTTLASGSRDSGNKTAGSGFSHSLQAFLARGTSLSEVRSSSRNGEKRESQAINEDVQSDDDNEEDADNIPGDVDDEEDEEEDDEELADDDSCHQSSHSQDFDVVDVVHPSNDDEYVDDDEKKRNEEARVAQLVARAEEKAARPTEQILHRASQVFRINSKRKDSTMNLQQTITLSINDIKTQLTWSNISTDQHKNKSQSEDDLKDLNPESKLSLTISKTDFSKMRIIGQFNLGFILAIRPSSPSSNPSPSSLEDHLFIIDQHAADEKYNFERLSRTTTLQPQRLVQAKELQLSAVEEELITTNKASLDANGFQIEISHFDSNENEIEVQKRTYKLLSLPTSRETTFSISDLEELLHLFSETAAVGRGNDIVRPNKVRRILASRACRSSIMIGKSLAKQQMEKVVRNMGEMDKPWNCPHGRPTMRHLARLGEWDDRLKERREEMIDWKGFLQD